MVVSNGFAVVGPRFIERGIDALRTHAPFHEVQVAVGLLPGSAHPGQSGNIVLAGHRDTFFWPLQDIERGDQIRIVEPQRTYRYRVDSIRVVDPNETSALASKGVEELTLVTCYPFRYVGPAPQRFIVSATRLE